MKQWPKDGKPAQFSKLVDPIVRAIKFAYKLERKNDGKNIPWAGYNIGKKDLCCCLAANEKLKAKNLAWALDDQGRDALDEIVCLAVQLGIEQGRRVRAESQESIIAMLDINMRAATGCVFDLKGEDR